MKPKISIIFPVYNVEKHVRSALESLTTQTFREVEIIAIDDCGQDGSMQIVSEFAARDGRIRIIRQKKNCGLSAARNAGLGAARAPYIMCCDSDDEYAPQMCEKMYAAIQQSGADIAMCGMDIVYEPGTEGIKKSDDSYYEIKFLGLNKITDELKNCIDFSVCNKIMRREIIWKNGIEYPPGLNYEDAYFLNAYLAVSKDIFFIKDKLYRYLRHADSIMSDTFSKKKGISIQHLQVGIIFYDFLKRRGLFTANKDYMADTFFAYLDFSLRHEADADEKKKIIKLAQNFIRKEKWESLSWKQSIRRHMQMLESGAILCEKRKYMGGLIKIKETRNRKRIYFIGILVYKARYCDKNEKHYLFGFIPVGKKSYAPRIKISVLMPAYNSEKYIAEAIDSILSQTFTNFEFIIINDGSTDKTAEIVRAYADPRIVFVDNKKNHGVIAVLNQGMEMCRGEYIARMDSDDISFPERFAEQVEFMDKHKKVGVLGTYFHIFGNGIDRIETKPLYAGLKEMTKTSPVGHPTAMIRKSVFDAHNLRYNSRYKYCEDYELWLRAAGFTKIANLQKVLLRYRWHGKNVSLIHEKEQLLNSQVVKIKIKKALGRESQVLQIPLDDSILLAELRELGEFGYMPNSGNMGDMLIASATMDWFDRNGLAWKRVEENKTPRNFVYGGGGGWRREWIEYMRPTMDLMQKSARIVILPSSFDNVPEFIDILDERFVVFCREEKSFGYLVAAGTKAKIILDHDMALRLSDAIWEKNESPSKKLSQMANTLAKKIAKLPKETKLFRKDSESAGNYASDLDLSDQMGWFGQFEPRDDIDFVAQTLLKILSKFDIVKTDRLHVGIAAALTGADVCLFDNNYGKISGAYNQSLCNLPNVRLCGKRE
ncbi:MAG: glycosyltransferase [Rickettsiales bacterium]|jgi:glycosyltransferase involved in cell wall biosynthesis|nr:glycosyltransferase [Rickettsiales bacterium]